MISVIMPTHRKPPMLHLTLLSVLSQDYDDFELIVVDASNDGYFKDEFERLMKDDHLLVWYSHKKKNVKILRPEENRQLPGAMKMYGFRNSVQDNGFCIFLDHDDFLWSNTLKNIHNAVFAYPDCDMVGMDYTSMVYIDGNVFTNKKTYVGGEVCGSTDTIYIDRFYFKFSGQQDIYRNTHPFKSPLCPKIISKRALRDNRFSFVEDTETMDDCAFAIMSHALKEVYIYAVGYVYVGYYNSNSTSGRKVSECAKKIMDNSNIYDSMLSEMGYVKHRDVYVP